LESADRQHGYGQQVDRFPADLDIIDKIHRLFSFSINRLVNYEQSMHGYNDYTTDEAKIAHSISKQISYYLI
jgi:hypothetical protein